MMARKISSTSSVVIMGTSADNNAPQEVKVRINARQHGTRTTYVTGCRCEPCKEADRAYHRDYYARRKDEPDSPWRRRLKGRVKRLERLDPRGGPLHPENPR